MIQDQLHIVLSQERERVPRIKKIFALKNGLLSSLSKNTAFIVKLLRNSTDSFSNQSLISLNLNEISRLQNKSTD